MKNNRNCWALAKKLIPGGTQLLSKNPDRFCPDYWPAYYHAANDIMVEDIDGRQFFDFSLFGIGACPLGFNAPKVTAAVVKAAEAGVACTLNCREEVILAQRLIDLHRGMEMVRFTRSGGEACSLAVRIARTFAGSNRQGVIISGYHGWHDWYLACNLNSNDSLRSMLLPGLGADGVPEALESTIYSFLEGDLDKLSTLLHDHGSSIGVLIMEPWRSNLPDQQYLEAVRKLCNDYGIVLIFDEISSGFRLSIGGSYNTFNVVPDMVVLGKALGNGHAISAVLGRRDVMEASESTFISSTQWTERLGPAAALAVLEAFEHDRAVDKIAANGKYLRESLARIAESEGYPMKIGSVNAVISIGFQDQESSLYETLFTQEMLKAGFLASTCIYVSVKHTSELSSNYLSAAEKALRHIFSQPNPHAILDGRIKHTGFKRLTK